MISMNNFSFRAGRSSSVIAVVAGLLAILAGGTAIGQTAAPAPSAAPVVIYQPQQSQQPPSNGQNNENILQDDLRSQQRQATTLVATTSPTEFQQIVSSTTGRPLPIFGAEMFRDVPSTFSPVENVPVTPEYVIGPGDEIRLQIWGQVNQVNSYTVDRAGDIYIPSVGPVHVAGVQFAQLTDFLKSQLSRVYRNFDLNVNMGQLRSIQVFVVGEARQPGSYTVSSLSTLLNALFASGGPLPQGSLRDIQVKRGGTAITHFDLYDLLLHGDKSKDVRLESGDVIFIPAVGPQAAVLGSVNNPAIYELRGETTFEQVIALAGGRTTLAAGTGIRVERISEHKERSVMDVDLSAANVTPVQNGDIITVSPIVDRFKDAVTLRGNVANPGRYAWFSGMRISDLIPDRQALITRDYYEKTNQLGQSNSDYRGINGQEGALGIAGSGSQVTSQPGVANSTMVNGQRVNGDVNDTLQNGMPAAMNGQVDNAGANPSAAQVTKKPATQAASSAGEALVTRNGRFAATTDVILQAPDIDWDYAVIERQNPDTLTTSLIPFNLGKAIKDKDASQNMELKQGDVVTIFSQADVRVPNAQQTRFVRLEGEFAAAGVYSVQPGETLRQLVARAGGFTPDAYLYASEFTRESVKRLEKQRLDEYADHLESDISAQTTAAVNGAISPSDATAAQSSADYAEKLVNIMRAAQPSGRIVLDLKPESRELSAIPDIPLEDGDRFVVPRIPSSVTVEGQVYNANAFVWQPGRRVKNYLKMAGGPDRSADRRRAYVLRADGSVFSNQYGDFEHAAMYPGDTVVVPPIIQKTNVLRELGNIATILAGFGAEVDRKLLRQIGSRRAVPVADHLGRHACTYALWRHVAGDDRCCRDHAPIT